MNVAVVVPTIRDEHMKAWLQNWQGAIKDAGARLYVVRDEPETWKRIEVDLGERAWIIQRRGSGIRCYGFLQALRDGADVIVTYDDDVEPLTDSIRRHVRNLTGPRHEDAWVPTTGVCRTRGFPYKSLERTLQPGISHGLWTGTPDLDGMTQLVEPWHKLTQMDSSLTLPRGKFFTMCSMNTAFRREIAPAMYFPLMNGPFKRFDDIWCGIIAKKVCDHLGLYCTNGAPYVHHTRASDAFKNMLAEAPGVVENEHFWKIIDDTEMVGTTPDACVQDIAVQLDRQEDPYYHELARALVTWCDLVEEAQP